MKRILLIISFLLVTFLAGCTLSSTTASTTTLPTLISSTSSSQTTLPPITTDTLISTSENAEGPTYETLFNNAIKHRFVISFSQSNFDKLIDDMQNYYDEFGSYRDNTIQEVDIRYEDSSGSFVELNEVGFRTKGNIFSRVLPVILEDGDVVGYQQVSFQLEFNDTFDYSEGSTQYKNLKERRMFDLEQLNFKYIRPDDTGVVTEMVAYDFFLSIGVPAPQTSLAIIYFDIDGTLIPYGLFTVTEPLDDVFARRVFGKNNDGSLGDLYKCVWQEYGPATLKDNYSLSAVGISDYNDGYRKNYQLKTNKTISYQGVEYPRTDFTVFHHFVNQLNDYSDTLAYQNTLESILDVDTWLKALAMGFLIGNPDDYRNDANNYYLYFYENQAVYIPFDFDQCLGYGWNPFEDYGISLDIYDKTISQKYSIDQADLVLVNNVLAFEEYQERYENYILEYTNPETGVFSVQTYLDEFSLAKTLYETELNENGHLGLRVFDLSERTMSVQSYFQQKIIYARAYVDYYQSN